MGTLCCPVGKPPRSGSSGVFVIDSDEEGCEVVKVSDVACCLEAFPDLTQSVFCVRIANSFGLTLMLTGVGVVLLLCRLCLALCWLLVMLKCVLTSCGNGCLLSKGLGWSVRNQCPLFCGVQLFSSISVNVEHPTQAKMAAGPWQGWQSWGASSCSLDEGKWDIKRQEVDNEVHEFRSVERSEGILDVKN